MAYNTKMNTEITHALVEETRPPIYTAMKYWGKKPHNIWNQYISTYVPQGGVILDPFCGSAMSAFEAVKAGRRCIAFDLNPLSAFIVDVTLSNFEQSKFHQSAMDLIKKIEADNVYQTFFRSKSRFSDEWVDVHCFKWEADALVSLGLQKTPSHLSDERKNQKSRTPPYYESRPNAKDIKAAREMAAIKIPFYHPNEPFHHSPSFSANFIRCIGGNNFGNLWTPRNLYVLAKIFNEIISLPQNDLQKQLLCGFVQSAHLCTKMSVPRRAAANRPFSTSWGRSAYICAARKMEMNALHVFKSSCLGKQSVESLLTAAAHYVGKPTKTVKVSHAHKMKNNRTAFDIKYGTVDANLLADYVPDKSVDFVITDPPYGDLVQYLDLSSIWLNWLKHWDSSFAPDYDAEITIKTGMIEEQDYYRRFSNALENIARALKDDGYAVFTFHHKKINIWNLFLRALDDAGLVVVRVIHQYNRRSGEAAVANPYGTSATDFYIQCRKRKDGAPALVNRNFADFVVAAAIKVISMRNEPTPYQLLESGILVQVSQGGFTLDGFNKNIEEILRTKEGEIFTVEKNPTNKAGDYWWLSDPAKHITYPDIPLRRRVDEVLVNLFRRRAVVTFDDVLSEIFPKFINGLTPDVRNLNHTLNRYATKAGGKWKVLSASQIEEEISRHTEALKKLAKIGQKAGFSVFIGKREQPEQAGDGLRLQDFANFSDLPDIGVKDKQLKRIKMIDMLWLTPKDGRFFVAYAFEIENTTDFIAAIQRGSNLSRETPKIMVLPDERQQELKRTQDPMFVSNFRNYQWRYMTYCALDKIASMRKISPADVANFCHDL